MVESLSGARTKTKQTQTTKTIPFPLLIPTRKKVSKVNR